MKILFIGETWITHTVHIKGIDAFEQSGFGCGIQWVKAALEQAGHTFVHLPSHQAIDGFPLETLDTFDVVICSDVGSNTLLLSTATMVDSAVRPNVLKEIQKYVGNGGSFAMIGGYMSFQGIDGKACYAGSPIEEILPVTLKTTDDRVEAPEGVTPVVVMDHPAVHGLEKEWPSVLGYNQIFPKEGGQVLVTCGQDVLVAVGQYGKGRTMAFATDCAPHWAPPTFLDWEGYAKFWQQAVQWLGNRI